MSKQLLIMRHAKSSWADPGMSDYSRPLNERGLRDVPEMASFLISQQCVPKTILSSSAVRAKQTAELLVSRLPTRAAIDLRLIEELYHAPPGKYLDQLASLSNDSQGLVMVVGHNPGLEEMVYKLSGRYESMPTAAIASFLFQTDQWSEISSKNATLMAIWRPKEL